MSVAYKFILINSIPRKKKQKSIKLQKKFYPVRNYLIYIWNWRQPIKAPFLDANHSLIDILGKLEEQSQAGTESRNLCLKNHYDQLYLASSFQEPFLQSTNLWYYLARFSVTDGRSTFICINEVEAVLVCASGFHVVWACMTCFFCPLMTIRTCNTQPILQSPQV